MDTRSPFPKPATNPAESTVKYIVVDQAVEQVLIFLPLLIYCREVELTKSIIHNVFDLGVSMAGVRSTATMNRVGVGVIVGDAVGDRVGVAEGTLVAPTIWVGGGITELFSLAQATTVQTNIEMNRKRTGRGSLVGKGTRTILSVGLTM